MTSPQGGILGQFCGPPNNYSVIWPNKDYGYCEELLVFSMTSNILLAITSALYIGYLQKSQSINLKRSRAVKVRLIIALVLAIVPLTNIIVSLTNPAKSLTPVEYLTYGTAVVAWVVHYGYLRRLRRAGLDHVRGHVPILVLWPLTLLASAVNVARIFKEEHVEKPTTFEVIEEVFTITELSVQTIYLITLLPSPRHVRANYEVSSERSIFPTINDDETTPLLSRTQTSANDEYGFPLELGIAEENAGFISKATFWWIQPLMARGAKGRLKSSEDVFVLPRPLQTQNVESAFNEFFLRGSFSKGIIDYTNSFDDIHHEDVPCDTLFAAHNKRTENSNDCQVKHSENPTLLKALLKVFGLSYFALGIVKFISDMLSFAGPLLLNALVSFIESGDTEPVINGWLYAIGLSLSSLVVAFMTVHYNYQIYKILIRMRAALVTTVYRKSLAVSSTTLSQFTTGQIVNFMSIDTECIINICQSFHELWSLPVKIGVALFLLHQQLGLAFLTGVAFTLILIALTKWLTGKVQKYLEDLMKRKDDRIKVMNEILCGIRVIKFYAWERHFADRIRHLREHELASLRGVKYMDALCVFLWATTPTLISLLSFATYVLLGNQLDAAKVFTSLSLFNMLIGPLNSFPWVLNGVVQALVSLRRVQKFLLLEELDLSRYYAPADTMHFNSCLEIEDGSFQWEDHLSSGKSEKSDRTQEGAELETQEEAEFKTQEEGHTLHLTNLNLRVCKGQLVGVIGCVGSGKSSVLSAITAEMTKTGGSVSVTNLSGGFGLAAQEAWIQHATLRDNILFGMEYVPKKYRAVVEACALLEDVRILPAGDMTEIGENGVTLSGGQKARVSLARAVYQDKEVYLMDDPLAAVDAHVGAHIFSQCIMGLLRDKTRILCTHHTKYLQEADLVVVMQRGEMVSSGHPSSILTNTDLMSNLQYAEDGKEEVPDPTTTGDSWTEPEEDGGKDGKLIGEEEQDVGVVKLPVYTAYLRAVGKKLTWLILLALFLMQASKNAIDLWLSFWVTDSHTSGPINSSSLTNEPITETQLASPTLPSVSVPYIAINLTSSDNLAYYLGIYGGLAAANSIFSLFRAFLFAYGGLCAARTIHVKLISSILKAPISFFDVTPIGRIINRFSSDMYTIDDNLSFILNIFLASLFGTIGALAVTCYSLPWFALVLVPMILVYLFIQNYYRKTSRELRRIESVTMSPIYAHFSETLTGLPTIRALRAVNRFRFENATRLETNQRARFCSFAVTCWLSFGLQMLGVAIITSVALIAITEHQLKSVNPGLVGLAISYTLSITAMLQSMVTNFTETEKNMVSMERAGQYTDDLPTEQQDGLFKPPPKWPHSGQLSFKDVTFAYRPSLPNALDRVSLDVRPAEKLGIVGRTGSGKSSLLLVLFRMVELQGGQVTIDGVDTKHLSLEQLRSSLAVIPQDPFVFIGNIRENLDPRGNFTDHELWSVLAKCQLKPVVEMLGGLGAQAGEKGRQFSVGQRQLLCLARAMLTGAKILCIDEATASVDMATDQLLQETISREFADSTVLTIAHRVHTILHSDRVLVMSGGRVAELDSPGRLMENEESMFYKLVNSGGDIAAT